MGARVATPRPDPRRRPGRAAAPPRHASAEARALRLYFETLDRALGPQRWWPARTRLEVIVGAILTQNTSWTNVERAVANLRRAKLLSVSALTRVPPARLAACVRPSGYFRQKAAKLKAFLEFLRRGYAGSLARMFRAPTEELRTALLGVHGIGPETADSILLYAGERPVFVVDAYTRRILLRHALIAEKEGYEEVRARFEQGLPADPRLFNQYHALLVQVGKRWCRPREARCAACPLGDFLPAPPAVPAEARR